MISRFHHRTSGLTIVVEHLFNHNGNETYDVTFRRKGKTIGKLERVGTPRCRTASNARTDDDRLAAQAALSFVQAGPCASACEREEDPSLQAWQDLTDAIGSSIWGDRQNECGEDIFWLRRVG